MSLASFQLSFLPASSSPLSRRRRHCRRSSNLLYSPVAASKLPDHHHPNGGDDNGLAKLAIATLAAGVLTLGSGHDASAAKTGGRVGGQAFRSAAPPRASSPRINNNNSRTNIYINPRVAPPLVGGYGYGYGYGVPYYGGWGWSPVGIGGGFDTLLLFIFLGTVAAFARRLFGTRQDDDDDDY